MKIADLFANVTATKAAFGWSCNFTTVSLTAPGNLERKGKAARFDGITIKNHILWWDDWSFVETLKEFALQEYPAIKRIASSEFGSDHVADRLSKLRCFTPDGNKAWSWGEIALLLESLDRNQLSTFGTFWLSPDEGYSKAGYHTDRLVEVLANCYTSPSGRPPVDQATPIKDAPIYSPAELRAIELYNEGTKPKKIDDLILSSKSFKHERWTGQDWQGENGERRNLATKNKPLKWVKGDAQDLVRHAKDNSVIPRSKRRVSS